MVKHTDIMELIKRIIQISNNQDTPNSEKLQDIILFLTEITETSKGSIMLKKNKLGMEVVASTNKELIGIKQPLNGDSPSCWVFKNKIPLYIDKKDSFSGQYADKGNYSKIAFLVIPVIRNNEVIGVINLTEKKDHDSFSNEERAALLDIAGLIISQIETFRLAEELQENQKVLKNKNSQLEKLEKLRSDFFQMMVHDLKGPVSEVIANLDILSYTGKKENQEYVKAAQSGCDNMYRMISNLLDITRIEDGSLKLISEKISASDIIEEASSRLFATAKNEGIQIIQEIKEKEELYIWGDRGVLLRVFQNIIMNAIQHSKTKSKIHAGFQTSDNSVIFYIKDNGKGIKPELQELIFDKYFHTREGTSSTGLGLAFCKLAVESHKGKLWVESDGIKGSCFKFIIPQIKEIEEDSELDFRD